MALFWIPKAMCPFLPADRHPYSESQTIYGTRQTLHDDDVINWIHFPCYWPFVRWPVNPPHKGQWRRLISDLRLSKRLGKHSRRLWFETPSRPLWRHRNAVLLLFRQCTCMACLHSLDTFVWRHANNSPINMAIPLRDNFVLWLYVWLGSIAFLSFNSISSCMIN